MSFLIVLAALYFLMFVAYRGYSVILFAPIAALGAVLLTDPSLVAPMFTGLFMDKMVGFLKLYFPVFLLGAVFGKLIEISGFSKAIVAATIKVVRAQRAMLSIVLVCALLTYGGVSLFVVVFAVYPFAAELFRQSDIPKRLVPGTIALGAFTFTMDALPGTPQIQNIIPTAFFGTTSWAAPTLGIIGGALVGTFMGVFLAYGLVGPFAARLTAIINEEAAYYKIIQSVLVAHLHGNAAQISVEIGRGDIPSAAQPSFGEMEEALNSITAD